MSTVDHRLYSTGQKRIELPVSLADVREMSKALPEKISRKFMKRLVGASGFEPEASCAQGKQYNAK
jgi:hypothetical protein